MSLRNRQGDGPLTGGGSRGVCVARGGGCFLSCHAVGGSGWAPSHLRALGGLGLDEQATTQLCRAQRRRGHVGDWFRIRCQERLLGSLRRLVAPRGCFFPGWTGGARRWPGRVWGHCLDGCQPWVPGAALPQSRASRSPGGCAAGRQRPSTPHLPGPWNNNLDKPGLRDSTPWRLPLLRKKRRQ